MPPHKTDLVPFQEYLFEYRYDGATYGFTIPAESVEDAKARLQAMADGGVFLGITDRKIPLANETPTMLTILLTLYLDFCIWLRNWFERMWYRK